jgi:hypothetical protein
MAVRKTQTQTTVIVEQASTVELTKKGSSNSLVIKVRRGPKLLGTLVMGKGSVEWWPEKNKTNCLRKSWTGFAALLDNEMRK